MKSLLAALVLIAVSTPGAFAAPGDPRSLQGTLEWPASLSAEPFIVVRGDDGAHYYADISSAARRGSGLAAGTRMSVLGVEGSRPFEIAAVVIGPGNSAIVGGAASAPGDAVSASPPSAPAARPAPQAAAAAPPPAAETSAPPFWQVEGKVVSVTAREMVLETRNGERTYVNVENLSPWTRDLVGPGDEVKLFGEDRGERRLVANGFIYLMPPPAASPRTGR